jgi:hypothetical protein
VCTCFDDWGSDDRFLEPPNKLLNRDVFSSFIAYNFLSVQKYRKAGCTPCSHFRDLPGHISFAFRTTLNVISLAIAGTLP